MCEKRRKRDQYRDAAEVRIHASGKCHGNPGHHLGGLAGHRLIVKQRRERNSIQREPIRPIGKGEFLAAKEVLNEQQHSHKQEAEREVIECA